MKKPIYIALFFFLLCGMAYAEDNVRKAKEFMDSNMYPEARMLLEKEVLGIGGDLSKGNPRNHEAQFLLGLCYVREGKLNAADDRFRSAVQLKPDYGYKISRALKDVGMDVVRQDQLKTALMIFERAEYYEPAIMKNVVRELLATGKTFLGNGREDKADTAFTAAITIDPSSEAEACNPQYAAGWKATDEIAISAYPLKTYCPTSNKMVGERLATIARNKAMTGKEAEKERYKKAAVKYLGEEFVDVLLPEVVVHDPGEYIFELKAGEQVPYWIDFPDNRKTEYKISSTIGSEFEKLYSDGKVIGMNDYYGGKYLKLKFRCKTDCRIWMVVE